MKEEAKTFCLRVPVKLKQRLEEVSKSNRKSQSKLIIEAIEFYLAENENLDLSFAIEGLEELKDGCSDKSCVKLDAAVKKLKSK